MSGSGISWAICKSAPRSRQITTPAPHRSVFLQARCPSCRPTNSVKALKATENLWHKWNRFFEHYIPFPSPNQQHRKYQRGIIRYKQKMQQRQKIEVHRKHVGNRRECMSQIWHDCHQYCQTPALCISAVIHTSAAMMSVFKQLSGPWDRHRTCTRFMLRHTWQVLYIWNKQHSNTAQATMQ